MSYISNSAVRRQRNYLLGADCFSLAPFCTSDGGAAKRCVLMLHCDDPQSDQYFGDVAALYHFNGVRDDYSANNATLTFTGSARLDLANSWELGQGSAWFPNAGGGAVVSSVPINYTSATANSYIVWEMAIYPEAAGDICRFGSQTVSINAGGTVTVSGIFGGTFTYVASFNQWHMFGLVITNNAGAESATLFRNGGNQISGGGLAGFVGGAISIGGNASANFKGRVSALRVTTGVFGNQRYQTATAYNLQPGGNVNTGGVTPFGNTSNTLLTDNSCSNPKNVNILDRATCNPIYRQFNRGAWIPRYRDNNNSLSGIVVDASADFNMGTDEWSVCGRAMRQDNARQGQVFYFEEAGGSFELQIGVTGLVSITYRSSGGPQAIATASGITLNVNFHWLVQRRNIGGVPFWETYLNGTLIDQRAVTGGAASTVNFTGALYFGRSNVTDVRQINGMMDEIVMVRGGTLVSGNFVPPSGPYCSCC